MALSVNPQLEIINTNDTIYLVDVTGDYNAVTNPFGWGSPNESRASLTAITAAVEYPDGQTASLTLTGTTFDDDTSRAYNASSLQKQDGVYKFDVTYTISINSETITSRGLRDNTVKCQLRALALGDTKTNDYSEAKMLYDKMHTAFACGEWTLTKEILTELQLFFDDCGYTKIRCGCGC